MEDDMSELDKLIEAVEAGEPGEFRKANRAAFSTPCQDIALQLREEHCRHAFKGSLDAAKALHEALLPGWKKNMAFTEFADGSGAVTMFGPMPCDAGKWDFAPKFEARGDTQARAWLLAILRAYEAQQ